MDTSTYIQIRKKKKAILFISEETEKKADPAK